MIQSRAKVKERIYIPNLITKLIFFFFRISIATLIVQSVGFSIMKLRLSVQMFFGFFFQLSLEQRGVDRLVIGST